MVYTEFSQNNSDLGPQRPRFPTAISCLGDMWFPPNLFHLYQLENNKQINSIASIEWLLKHKYLFIIQMSKHYINDLPSVVQSLLAFRG